MSCHQFIIRGILVLCSGCLFSCASATLELHDASVDKAAIRSGPVAIGGVLQASTACGLTESIRNTVSDDLGKTLIRKRRKQDVWEWGLVRRMTGTPPLSTAGSSSLLSRSFSSADRKQLQIGGVNYVLFGFVKSNKVWEDVCESYDEETTEVRDKEGNVISCYTTTTYTTTSKTYRGISAEYHLYDLASGSKVWVTSSDYREANSRSRSSSICYPRPPQHPGPPSIADVMQNMSAAAIRKLPKK